MRSWLSTVALVAVATIGCDSAEDPAVEDAGAGGVGGGAGGEGGGAGGEGGEGGGAGGEGGGAGGEGGEGGGVGGQGGDGGGGAGGGGECGDLPVIDMNADGTAAGEGFTLTGTTGDTDLTSGSCTPAMSPGGSEVAVKFVAPSAALWQFDTVGSAAGVDTLVYALTDCNDGLSEVACNDDNGGVTSRILVQMAQGDTLFVVVDLFDGIAPTEFVLNATPVQATAPQLDAVEAFVNQDTQAIGLRMTGLDPENDVVGYNIAIFDADGVELGAQPFEFAAEDLTQENGMFRAQTVLGLGELAAEIAGVRISVIDDFGLESNSIDQPVEAPSEMLMRGDACEPAQVFALCPAEDACASEDNGETFACVLATPPAITEASVFVNPAAPFVVDIGGGPWQVGAIGMRLSGTDAENNPAFVNVLFFDAAGAELSVNGDGEAGVGLAVFQAENGTWRADAVVSFAGACAQGAATVFEDCANGGGAEEECLAAAETSLRDCNAALLARVASARLVPGDATNKTGAAFEVAMVAQTAVVAEGEACGLFETLGICAEGQYCYGPNGNAACGQPVVACAEGLPVVNLNDNMGGAGVWTFDGDSTDAANLVGNGTCGGGGPQALHSFTAPAAGTYVAEIIAGDGDTLLFVRTHCGLSDAEFELACNDDIDTQGMNYLSRVEFEAEANQVVTVVVDGYAGSFAGPYTVQVTAQ